MSTVVEEKINSNIIKKLHREVRFGNYILGSTLGEGEFGKVKLGWRKDGKLPNQVAIKLIKRDAILKDSELEIKIHREINSLKLLNHPNIVNLVEVMKSGKYIGIVLEYASGGELFDYILTHKYLKENLAKKFFAQLVSGVDYMHSKGLIHRDLKLENLLLDKNKNIIILDFGFVNSYNLNNNKDLMKTSCGSPCYAAPELVLMQLPYEGKKVDVWSLGIILYAMLSGYLPFDDDPNNEDGADIIKLYHYICKTPLTFPEYVSPLARDLLRKIIVPDPKKRININDIRNHPWLSPYANLLSIRQPEWDKIYHDKFKLNNLSASFTSSAANSAAKRYSMINQPTNSSQLVENEFRKPTHHHSHSMTTPRTHTRSTSSSTPATPAPTTSTTVPSASTSANTPTSTPTNAVQTHQRSASLSNSYTTLKSIVHENDENLSVNTKDTPVSIPQNSGTERNHEISTIVELPSRPPLSVIENPGPLPASHGMNPTTITGPNNYTTSVTNKLPHQAKRPRPTSYHPSNSYGSSSSLLDFKAPSPINIPISQFLNHSPRNSPPKPMPITNANTNTSTSTLNHNSSTNNSPNKSDLESLSLSSRRNSVVTPINVNGVLTRENSENKRNSIILYFEDRMNGLDLENSNLNLSLSPEKSELKESNEPTKEPETKETKVTETKESKDKKVKDSKESKELKERVRPRENKDKKADKETKRKNRFSILSIYSNSNYNSSSNNVDSLSSRGSSPSRQGSGDTPANGAASTNGTISGNSSQSNITDASQSFKKSNKEISAAKKVMDFFKRRSVRIN